MREFRSVAMLLLVAGLAAAMSCSPSDPVTDDIYTRGDIFIWDGSAYQPATYATGDVFASANLADNTVVRGDGGGKGVQDSLVTMSDLGTINAPTYTGGNIQVTGKVECDRLIGDVEGYSVDVVQASDLNIALNDTLAISFLFEPDVIVLDYSCRCVHDTTLESGHSTGHSVIAVTGVDTITYNTNSTSLIDNAGTLGSVTVQDNTTYVIVAFGGNDGVDDSSFMGSATWNTATHTMTVTFNPVSNTHTIFNFVEVVATAYR